MKTKSKTQTRIPSKKRLSTPSAPVKKPTRSFPRCSRCGSRTVHLEQIQQELLATLSLHCLICGHHTFLGKPVIRLIRRPEIPNPLSLKKAREAM